MRPRLLLVTDLNYPALGRRYGDEDVYLGSQLREHFTVAMCHPTQARHLSDGYDLVLVRNSGPTMHYAEADLRWREHALTTETKVYNSLDGHADQLGKSYLVELSRAGYSVIPTEDSVSAIAMLPSSMTYVIKPVHGADSSGVRFVAREDLAGAAMDSMLVQPFIAAQSEVSFVFVDDTFEYAVSTTDAEARWQLQPYAATDDDIEFARSFVSWNSMSHGIQRVDAMRTQDGDLLLVELEDLNPYLSLDVLDEATRERFVSDLILSISSLIA